MMPRLDGLQLVAALRADPRTAEVPVLLLSARAGQEAAIEGLEAGADDYLVKPFSAAELLARVRANVELARLRSHHARWRAALLDSLHEAFFVLDEDGAVVEINAAFTDMHGVRPGGPALRPRAAVVAGREGRPRGAPDAQGGPRAADDGQQGQLHRPARPPRRAPDLGIGQLQRGQGPRRTAAAGWWGRSATSRPSTTPCSGRRRWPRWAWWCPGPGAPPRSCRRRWGNCGGCGGRGRSPPRSGREPAR